MFDDEPGLDTSGGGFGADDAPAVEYLIDDGSPEGLSVTPEGEHAPAAPAPTPAPAEDGWRREIDELRRTNAETVAQLTPLMAQMRQQQTAQQTRPPFDPRELDTNPNLKPTDLLNYLRWEQQQTAQQLAAYSQATARATMSEMTARGQYTEAAMGPGGAYDAMVAQYIAPLVAENPAVDTLIHQVFPQDPAAGRMAVAVLREMVAASGDDLVKGLRSIRDALGAYKDGANAARKGFKQAAKLGRARIQSAAGAGTRTGTQKLSSYDDVQNLSDKSFERLWNQSGRG